MNATDAQREADMGDDMDMRYERWQARWFELDREFCERRQALENVLLDLDRERAEAVKAWIAECPDPAKRRGDGSVIDMRGERSYRPGPMSDG